MRTLIPFVLALLASCSSLSFPAPETGSQAPNFTLQDLGGASVTLSDLRGQIVLLNFWATWCGPCRVEMPIIQERYNDGGFAVLAINFDESADQVRGFADELSLTLPILLDPGGKIQELYRIRGYPTSFFVDPDGVVRVVHIGEMSERVLDDYLEQLGLIP